MVKNRVSLIVQVLSKKRILHVELINGFQFKIARSKLKALEVLKNLIDMNIQFERQNQVIRVKSKGSLEKLDFFLLGWTDSEFIVLCEVIHEILRYGFSVNAEPDGSETYQNVMFTIDSTKKLIITPNGCTFHIESLNPLILIETFVWKIHDRFVDTFKDLLVLDVGANFGDTSINFAKMGAKVIAVEPLEFNFKILEENVKLNDVKMDLFNCAIGPRGKLIFNFNQGEIDGGATAFYKHGSSKIEIDSYYVTDLLSLASVEEVDLLKMDCKGCEKFLRVEDIKKVKKYIQIEFDSLDSQQDVSKVLEMLRYCGFDYTILNHNFKTTMKHGSSLGTVYARRV